MNKQPAHIAFIPDGNRRWAKEKGLPSIEGHRVGYNRFKDVAKWCLKQGVKEVTFWGFSTENWKREKKEVQYLMQLFMNALTKDLEAFVAEEFQLHVIGRREDLSEKLIQAMEKAEAMTAKNTKRRLNLCFNYGGGPDVLQMAQQAAQTSEEVTEEWVTAHLWTAGMSRPDLIVRSSGEQRLSGFMPWLGRYSELYFPSCYWPDFTEHELRGALEWYAGRERRFGGNTK
jgi:undecaprenyl diphosphate synthase